MSSPFGKLKHKKYQILEALQFSGSLPQVTQWLYGLNQETRNFLSKYYIMIQRSYEVEGLNILTLNINKEEMFQSFLNF